MLQRKTRFQRLRQYGLLGVLAATSWLAGHCAWSDTVTLNNGLQLRGRIRTVNSVAEDLSQPVQPGSALGRIVVVDNGLYRTFVARKAVRAGGLAPDALINTEEIRLPKRVTTTLRTVDALGSIIRATEFDEFGNRICTIQSARGPVDVLQGITRITPDFVQVETLGSRSGFYWDMRLATSSFPRTKLTNWMRKGLEWSDLNDRQRVIALYMQAQRNRDALVELESTLKDFPFARDLVTTRRRLYQAVAEEVLDEIERRQDAGQFRFSQQLLRNFPREGIAGEVLLRVEDLLSEYELFAEQRARVIELLARHRAKLDGIADRERLDLILAEMRDHLNLNNVDRFADYLRLADDDQLSDDQKMALAVSGWLLGSGASRRNLPEALSLVHVRNLVRRYLQTTADEAADREQILQQLEEEEGSTPELLAPLIANMLPPIEVALPEDPTVPGMLELEFKIEPDDPPVRYVIQLPPEYDPYRRYPCVVALHPYGGTPQMEIDWWAGPYDAARATRLGQGTRHGYIVVAPEWNPDRSVKYDYSFRRHAIVLKTLRHAMRRFSIDSDRVFLAGHSMGGDAAWDIGVAHPDLWAGVIPIVARAERYVQYYRDNAEGLPFLCIGGELDGHWISDLGARLDRYVKSSGYDAMVVEFRGRGHEPFAESALLIFEWMNRHRRRDSPEEFAAASMRPWDNFFWWVELQGFRPDTMVLPELWPPESPKATKVTASRRGKNHLRVNTNTDSFTLWLSPREVDFEERIQLNGRRIEVQPSRRVLLEDARGRADRQHPYWAKWESKR